MTDRGDDMSERYAPVDDEFFEALLLGRETGGSDGAALSAFVGDVRTASGGPLPLASPQLAQLFAGRPSPDPLPKWRQLKMKVSRTLAGLGVAAKIALGAGVAAASATAAGAAGVLPGPAQSVMSDVVGTVTPFSIPDGSHAAHEADAPGPGVHDGPTTTTLASPPASTPDGGHGPEPEHHDGGGAPAVAPPPHETPSPTTPPREPQDEHHEVPVTTPTTEHHVELSMDLHCAPAVDAARVVCEWGAAPDGTAKVVLLRVTDGEPGRVPYQSDNPSNRRFVDSTVAAGRTYGYRIDALRPDGSVLAASPMVYVTTAAAPHVEPTTTTVPPHTGDAPAPTSTGT